MGMVFCRSNRKKYRQSTENLEILYAAPVEPVGGMAGTFREMEDVGKREPYWLPFDVRV